jgi:hypothetical protein
LSWLNAGAINNQAATPAATTNPTPSRSH